MTYIVSMVGESWTRETWEDVREDVRHACEQTVDDCEQEICHGHSWDMCEHEAGEARQECIDNLYAQVMTGIELQLGNGVPAKARVAPWYAVAQRMTFEITVKQED